MCPDCDVVAGTGLMEPFVHRLGRSATASALILGAIALLALIYTGTGGSSYPNLKAEFNAEPHVRGVCSMARAASPDSANSQFFIVFDDATFLDRKYTVWGQVIEGMENVDKIKRGEPVQNPDKIVKARMAADAA